MRFTKEFLAMLTIEVIGIALVIAFLAFLSVTALDKEAVRREQSFDKMCAHYADDINHHAGRDVCPPTPKG